MNARLRRGNQCLVGAHVAASTDGPPASARPLLVALPGGIPNVAFHARPLAAPVRTRSDVGPDAQPDIQALVMRAQRGDQGAFTELFRLHRLGVARIAYRMLGPSGDLEDVIQDVFLQVYRSLPDFRGESKFSTWLHRVTVNVVLMTRRRAHSRPVLPLDEGAEQAAEDSLPDHEVARARQLVAFRKLLDRLSEKKRAVFLLHEVEGLAPVAIANLLDCPVLTVRTRLFYARRELVEMMQDEPSLAALLSDSRGDCPPSRKEEADDDSADPSAGPRRKAPEAT
jgi:RNA polymerase sigma-70 factor (ECF subfamily)